MCGIMGVFGSEDAATAVVLGLKLMRERGRDGAGITDGKSIYHAKSIEELGDFEVYGQNCMGHVLHAMVGYVPEPIAGKKGIIVANCEIYNWKELAKRYGFQVRNDAELLARFLDHHFASGRLAKAYINAALEELDGVYAFAYWLGDELIIARDILGIKPVWYSITRGFAFASEKKALAALSYRNITELNPREIIRYSLTEGLPSFEQRPFINLGRESGVLFAHASDDIKEMLIESVRKRLPEKKLGLLFSGGVDSTVLARICQVLGVDFTCYTAVLDEPQTAEDLLYAQKIAEQYGFRHRIRKVALSEVEHYISKIAPLIEDTNVVKIGVALTFFVACEQAREDGIKVVFSGLGSEEIFAGYERHRKATDINKECLSGLLKLYERDTYRDDVVTMNNGIELRLPYLDLKLVRYALGLPAAFKLDNGKDKIILRQIAKELGIKDEFADRKKRAAQYGSRFDKAIERLARKERKRKSEFLKKYYTPPNLRLGVLFSTGKDSCYALHLMQRQNYQISCLITMKSDNIASYMFHTPNVEMARLQAEAMEIPLIEHQTKGKKEEELADLEYAIAKAKRLYHIEGIVTGALFSEYQRSRIERVADRLGLKVFSPLWHMDQEQLLRQLVASGFEVVLSSVAAFGLDQSWLGRKMDENFIQNLKTIHNMYKINMAGEGGEYESLVLDGPIFKKQIVIKKSEIEVEDSNTARMVVLEAELKEKMNAPAETSVAIASQ